MSNHKKKSESCRVQKSVQKIQGYDHESREAAATAAMRRRRAVCAARGGVGGGGAAPCAPRGKQRRKKAAAAQVFFCRAYASYVLKNLEVTFFLPSLIFCSTRRILIYCKLWICL